MTEVHFVPAEGWIIIRLPLPFDQQTICSILSHWLLCSASIRLLLEVTLVLLLTTDQLCTLHYGSTGHQHPAFVFPPATYFFLAWHFYDSDSEESAEAAAKTILAFLFFSPLFSYTTSIQSSETGTTLKKLETKWLQNTASRKSKLKQIESTPLVLTTF